MPVFNIPLDKPRPVRGSLTTEAARLKAKKDKEKKAAAARKAAQKTSGVTTSTQTDLTSAKTRSANKSLIMKTARSAVRSNSLKNEKPTLVQKQEKARTIRTTKIASNNKSNASNVSAKPITIASKNVTTEDKKLLTVIEPKKNNVKATILPSTPISPKSSTSTSKPTKVVNEKFKTVVPAQNISRTLKVTGLTEEELNKALKLAASKTKNTILKDLTKQMVQKPSKK